MSSESDESLLDNPAYFSLTGVDRELGWSAGRAVRYLPDVSPFGGLPSNARPEDWSELATIAGPTVGLLDAGPLPPGWQVRQRLDVLQMILPPTVADTHDEAFPARPLTVADVDDMLALVSVTHPGPFGPRTIDFGGYLGVKENGHLVAMAGERMRPPGWAEVSAVCTAPDHQGKGLGRRLVREVIHNIRKRGEQPFLHVMADNAAAIHLYESMGFTTRRPLSVTLVSPD